MNMNDKFFKEDYITDACESAVVSAHDFQVIVPFISYFLHQYLNSSRIAPMMAKKVKTIHHNFNLGRNPSCRFLKPPSLAKQSDGC